MKNIYHCTADEIDMVTLFLVAENKAILALGGDNRVLTIVLLTDMTWRTNLVLSFNKHLIIITFDYARAIQFLADDTLHADMDIKSVYVL